MDTRTNTQTGAKITFDEYLAESIENFEGPAAGEGEDRAVTRGLVQLLRVAQGPGGAVAMITAISNSIAAAMSALAIVTGSPSDAVALVMKIVGKHGLDFLPTPSAPSSPSNTKGPSQ